MTKDQLKKILKQHKLWLDTDGADGLRAYLSGAYLSGADLRCAVLTGADLSGAYLREADLCCAVLTGADLNETHLSRTNLIEAKGIVQFGPIGETRRIGYAVNHGDHAMVKLGCFWNTQDEAIKKIRKKYGENSTYEAFVNAACAEVLND